ncbi:MAG TPA: DNA polymerase I [Candidatus Baltobacteraceae bacterium]|nr:DNA polymerase I [Candidatus Baltobacteraceae bacterium]
MSAADFALAEVPGEDVRLMLLDTYGLVYRAFFALPALTTTRGEPINAAYGFTQMLTKIVADEKPTHVIAAFDKGLPQARVAIYEAYKAQRQAMPDDLRSQFALVRRILDVYRIPMLEIEGEEADDVIATLARQATEAGRRVEVVTGDLDLLQIVDERTTVLTTRRGITELGRYDPAAVRARFDLEPSQLTDYRGLKGDPSDNLPGIPGVGEKTAVKLIKAAGSLDALLANPGLAGSAKLEALVREHGETARLCRDVSIVARDLDVTIPWEAARWTPPSPEELYPLYRDLEFKSLLARLPAPANDALFALDESEMLRGTYRSFVASVDPPEFASLARGLEEAARAKRVAVVLRGDEIGISAAPETGLSFPRGALGMLHVAAAFETVLASSALALHDAKGVWAALGRTPGPLADDTMVAAHLLNPSRAYGNLAETASEYLALRVPEDTAAYADAIVRLVPVLRDRLNHREQLALYGDVELPLVTILGAMEARGIAVDAAALAELSREVDASAARLQEDIYALAGGPFNIGSPQQLGTVLFENLGLPSGGRTKTGWATGIEVLQPLAREHEIVAKVLEYREVTKLKNTYIDVIPKLVDARGRLHTVFHQTSTATGRLSSTNPNLQNVPVRGELGRRIRVAFVAPGPRRVLLAADYNQIELRIMAHLSGDEAMREAFRRGDDIHDVTARGIFGVLQPDRPTPNQRRIAKSVNFGLLYGMSEFGLAQRLGIERLEARAMTDAYFARFPRVREWIEANLEFGRERGYVETMLGRRRYFPDLRTRNFALRAAAEREATNAPMQGSAADLMKLAMVRVDAALGAAGLDAQLLLQIHDELIFEIDATQVAEIGALVKGELEGAFPLSVPIAVDLKTGRTWYDVEPLDLEPVDA